MHPFAAAKAPSLVLLLLLLFSLSTTQSLADANTANNNYNETSPISTDSHINQVIFDPDHHNSSSLPLLIHNNKNEDGGKTYEFNINARGKFKYFMELQLVLKDHKDVVNGYGGTPDTGSDLIWLNLTSARIEEPETPFGCKNDDDDGEKCKECKEMWSDLGMKEKEQDDNKCMFNIIYKDVTNYKGYFGNGSFRDSHDHEFKMKHGVSSGTAPEKKNSSGVVGLGRGNLSLFQQLNNSAHVEKFSYCLPPPEEEDQSNENARATGKLVFGSRVNTNPETSTPLLDENPEEKAKDPGKKAEDYCKTRYYCVNLTSIKVDGRQGILGKDTDTTEVMIIDSGSTFTYLRDKLFYQFLQHVKQKIGTCASGVTPKPYGCCFEKGSAEKLEKVSLGFNGTTVELEQKNFFDLKKDKGKDYLCLTVNKTDEGENDAPKVHILGSRAQMNFEVKFDVPNKKVSFDKVKTCNQEEKKKNSNDGVD